MQGLYIHQQRPLISITTHFLFIMLCFKLYNLISAQKSYNSCVKLGILVTCSASYLRKSCQLLYFYHLCFTCLIPPLVCRKWQTRNKKEAHEPKSARLSDLSTLKHASSSEQPFSTLSGRFPHASKFQATRLSVHNTLKRESSSEQLLCTLSGRFLHAPTKFKQPA